VLQDVAAQDEHPPAEVLPTFPPKTDIIRSAFFDLQVGQDIAGRSPAERNKTSNLLLHFLHLNS